MLDKITGWTFMNEPVKRWFIFLGVMIIISALWGIILSYMKKIVD